MEVVHGYRNQVCAGRLMTANQIVRQKFEAKIQTKKDMLDWLKYIRDEVELIDYSNPSFGIPPEKLCYYMTKATRDSLKLKKADIY